MIAVLCLSLVLGAVIASPTQHLLRNARDTQEVSVDTCTATETELGVTIGDDYTVDNDMLERKSRKETNCLLLILGLFLQFFRGRRAKPGRTTRNLARAACTC